MDNMRKHDKPGITTTSIEYPEEPEDEDDYPVEFNYYVNGNHFWTDYWPNDTTFKIAEAFAEDQDTTPEELMHDMMDNRFFEWAEKVEVKDGADPDNLTEDDLILPDEPFLE